MNHFVVEQHEQHFSPLSLTNWLLYLRSILVCASISSCIIKKVAPVTNRITWSIRRKEKGRERTRVEEEEETNKLCAILRHTTKVYWGELEHSSEALEQMEPPVSARTGATENLRVLLPAGDGLAMCHCLHVTLRVLSVTPTSCCNSLCSQSYTQILSTTRRTRAFSVHIGFFSWAHFTLLVVFICSLQKRTTFLGEQWQVLQIQLYNTPSD